MITRFAVHSDLQQLVDLLADDEFGRHRESPEELEVYRPALEAILADAAHEILVLEDGHCLVACVQISYLPNLTFKGTWRAQFEGVRVRSDRRGRGLGRQLMREAIERAQQQGCTLMQLTTALTRPKAQRFYEELGFQATHVGMKLQVPAL